MYTVMTARLLMSYSASCSAGKWWHNGVDGGGTRWRGALHVSVCARRKQWAAVVGTKARVVKVVELPASGRWWMWYTLTLEEKRRSLVPRSRRSREWSWR